MAPPDPLRRQLLLRAFFGMGLWGAGRLLPGCAKLDPEGDELGRARGDYGGAGAASAHARAPELSGREPLRYAHGASGRDEDVRVIGGAEGTAGAGGSGSMSPDVVEDLDPPHQPDEAARGIPLQPADALGLELPAGFSARIVAMSGQAVAASGYLWHGAPDGGACYGLSDGGHVYVSNAELNGGLGGVSALRFDAAAELIDAYPILGGTTRNCAGGPTPWGTWISCEEIASGLCWECDPLGVQPGVARPALGAFTHEAVTVDMQRKQIYLTEDQPDGRLYRYTASGTLPGGALDLQSGLLQVMEVTDDADGRVRWHAVPDPSGTTMATRLQVPASSAFAGGEGIWYADGMVFFTTKLDNRVWALDVVRGELTLIYDARWYANPVLTGVDNLTMTPSGHLLVAEDPGNLELVLLEADGTPHALLRVLGQPGSELAGPAFDPSGTRLYFSSQRGQGMGNLGITYEVTGPFASLAP